MAYGDTPAGDLQPIRHTLRVWLVQISLLTALWGIGAERLYANVPPISNPLPASPAAYPVTAVAGGDQILIREWRERQLLIDDIHVVYPIAQIGEQLAAYARTIRPGTTYTFWVMRDTAVNAFALPGGSVVLHSGLLRKMGAAGELAAVLAHEISHVQQNHLQRMDSQIRNAEWSTWGLLAGGALLANRHPNLGTGAITASVANLQDQSLRFSRTYEAEADRIAIPMMAQAGYDPRDMVRFLNRIQQLAHYQGSDIPVFLQTHPLPTQRLSDISHRLAAYPTHSPPDPIPFRILQADLEQAVGEQPQSQVVRTQQAANAHPDRWENQYAYARALVQTGQYPKAWAVLEPLEKSRPDLWQWYAVAIAIHLGLKQPEQAWAWWEKSRQRFGPILPVVYLGARLALTSGQPQRGIQGIQQWLREHKQRYASYLPMQWILSELYAADQRWVDAYIARADYHIAAGDPKAAYAHLNTVLAQKTYTPFEFSRLRAKINDVMAVCNRR